MSATTKAPPALSEAQRAVLAALTRGRQVLRSTEQKAGAKGGVRKVETATVVTPAGKAAAGAPKLDWRTVDGLARKGLLSAGKPGSANGVTTATLTITEEGRAALKASA